MDKVTEQFLLNEKMIYVGAFFTEKTVDDIVRKIGLRCKLEKWVPYRHVTFKFRPSQEEKIMYGIKVGEDIQFKVVGFANNGKNSAVQVEIIYHDKLYKNESVPYITLYVSEDGHPKDSGSLKFEPIDEPFYISGKFGYYRGDIIIVNTHSYPTSDQAQREVAAGYTGL